MVNIPGDKNITVKINDAFIARMDRIARMGKISRHQLAKNIIELGVEELEKLKMIGIFQLAIFIRDMAGNVIKKPLDTISGEKPIPVKLDEDFVKRLDILADKAGLTRHQMMKNILKTGLEELESLAKVGVIRLTVIIRELPQSFRNISSLGEVAYKSTQGMQFNKGGSIDFKARKI